MTGDRHTEQRDCRVVAGEKFLKLVDARTLCDEIKNAVAARAPGANYSIEISLLSRSRVSAIAIVNGRVLPRHNLAVMDSTLDHGAIGRFARSLAEDVAKAANK